VAEISSSKASDCAARKIIKDRDTARLSIARSPKNNLLGTFRNMVMRFVFILPNLPSDQQIVLQGWYAERKGGAFPQFISKSGVYHLSVIPDFQQIIVNLA
jgi:hypothetical protein